MNVRVLDLFTGTGSIKKVCEELNFKVVSLDIDPKFNPDVCADILTFDFQCVWKPGDFDIIWASPPCQVFSRARQCNIGKTINGETMTRATLERDTINLGVPLLRKTEEIIVYLKPQKWFIENPYFGSMKNYIDSECYIFDYCMFGFEYRKRTSIWSNLKLKDCMCDRSHLINGRHKMAAKGSYNKAQTGQGGGKCKIGRYAIPSELVEYLITS